MRIFGVISGWVVAGVAALCLSASAASETQVQLDFFFSPGCTECAAVKADVFPVLEERFGDLYEIVPHDLHAVTNVPLLVAYQQRLGGGRDNARVSIAVDRSVLLNGYAVIATGLVDQIDAALLRRQEPDWAIPPPILADAAAAGQVVARQAGVLTFSVVAFGGLLDGFNPCAISTLIFFMSLLGVAKVGPRIRLLVGLSFIAASFAVYMALGLGFFYALRAAPDFAGVKRLFELAMGLAMLPLAWFSFRDAFRFRRSGRAEDVTLQIPKAIKSRMHWVMRDGLGVGGPILGGLLTGAAVTVLESVCTGQSYVPILMYMLKNGGSQPRVWCMLVLYNLLFVAPLVVVFICFHRGMQLQTLIAWSRRNLVVAKILLGVFFLSMAALLLY